MPKIHLSYQWSPDDSERSTATSPLHHPLMALLQAVRGSGSISMAAKVLGLSYRHVWGELKRWEQSLDHPLIVWEKGQAARLTEFADKLLWAERQAQARLAPQISALQAELEKTFAQAFDPDSHVLTVYASHDDALVKLREHAADESLHLDMRFCGSVDAIRALNEGRCTVAGFHVPPLQDGAALFSASLKPLLKPGTHKLIGCSRRTQGLMVAAGNQLAIKSLADVAALRARFLWRQAGSATRLLTQHLLAQAHLEEHQLRDAGTEDSHNAVAAAVAGGQADAGIGLEAAARAFGLAFVPLAQDEYFLVCLAHALEEPAVQALRRTLEHAQWQQAVAALPGYELMQPGRVLSLTTALPWWHFRKPKA